MRVLQAAVLLALASALGAMHSPSGPPWQAVKARYDGHFQSLALLFPDQPDSRLIPLHFSLLLERLRAKPTPGLSPVQRAQRRRLLGILERYGKEGRFPVNTRVAGRSPVFIDEYGTHCAVAFLIKESGHGFAREIAQAQNLAYVGEIRHPKMPPWIEESGLTLEECAMIQPMYMEDLSALNLGGMAPLRPRALAQDTLSLEAKLGYLSFGRAMAERFEGHIMDAELELGFGLGHGLELGLAGGNSTQRNTTCQVLDCGSYHDSSKGMAAIMGKYQLLGFAGGLNRMAVGIEARQFSISGQSVAIGSASLSYGRVMGPYSPSLSLGYGQKLYGLDDFRALDTALNLEIGLFKNFFLGAWVLVRSPLSGGSSSSGAGLSVQFEIPG